MMNHDLQLACPNPRAGGKCSTARISGRRLRQGVLGAPRGHGTPHPSHYEWLAVTIGQRTVSWQLGWCYDWPPRVLGRLTALSHAAHKVAQLVPSVATRGYEWVAITNGQDQSWQLGWWSSRIGIALTCNSECFQYEWAKFGRPDI